MANPKMTCRKVSISRIFNLADEDTVDGCEILHELKTVVSPILCRVSTILLVVFVFFPSTISLSKECLDVNIFAQRSLLNDIVD
jgi:uncharacterized membrane protein (DUF485 family)